VHEIQTPQPGSDRGSHQVKSRTRHSISQAVGLWAFKIWSFLLFHVPNPGTFDLGWLLNKRFDRLNSSKNRLILTFAHSFHWVSKLISILIHILRNPLFIDSSYSRILSTFAELLSLFGFSVISQGKCQFMNFWPMLASSFLWKSAH